MEGGCPDSRTLRSWKKKKTKRKREEKKGVNGLASGFWLLASGFWLLASGFWLLASGFWLLASGFLASDFWLLASGFWLLASGLLGSFRFLSAASLIAGVFRILSFGFFDLRLLRSSDFAWIFSFASSGFQPWFLLAYAFLSWLLRSFFTWCFSFPCCFCWRSRQEARAGEFQQVCQKQGERQKCF